MRDGKSWTHPQGRGCIRVRIPDANMDTQDFSGSRSAQLGLRFEF